MAVVSVSKDEFELKFHERINRLAEAEERRMKRQSPEVMAPRMTELAEVGFRISRVVEVGFRKAMEAVVMVEVERDGGLGAVEKSKPEVGEVEKSKWEVEVTSISQVVVGMVVAG